MCEGMPNPFRIGSRIQIYNYSTQGNETRMGKGKGGFEFWATRVGPARVIFEIGTPAGTPPIREELARDGESVPAKHSASPSNNVL